MAKALECPACGAKHRLDGFEASSTFRCGRCGQKLKVPASVAASLPAAPARPRPATSVAPPPRRRSRGGATSTVIGASATVDAAGAGPRLVGDDNGQSPPGSRTAGRATGAARPRVRWYWRVVAWVVAVPLGFLAGVVPAYELGFIEKDDVLDVFVGSGADRYVRLAIVTLLWALATAILVQLFVEGGRWWAERRRRPRAARGAATGA